MLEIINTTTLLNHHHIHTIIKVTHKCYIFLFVKTQNNIIRNNNDGFNWTPIHEEEADKVHGTHGFLGEPPSSLPKGSNCGKRQSSYSGL
jgi:hypothetical protein